MQRKEDFRVYASTLIMAGFASTPTDSLPPIRSRRDNEGTLSYYARIACDWADALYEELVKREEDDRDRKVSE